MKPFSCIVGIFLIFVSLFVDFGRTFSAAAGAFGSADTPPLLRCLTETYTAYIEHVEEEDGGPSVVMKNGSRWVFEDGRQKNFETMLSDPDLADQFRFVYPRGSPKRTPQKNDDPGRIRVEGFFAAVYGDTEEEVQKRLVAVKWPSVPGKSIRFNREMGAADALSNVGRALFAEGGEARRIARTVGGTFSYRFIAGTRRRSAHAFGIAVDIDVRRSAYWRWSKTFPRFENNMPQRVVDIFEKNGFIWGGKWYHFDTMHFEFRPEMFCSDRMEASRRSAR